MARGEGGAGRGGTVAAARAGNTPARQKGEVGEHGGTNADRQGTSARQRRWGRGWVVAARGGDGGNAPRGLAPGRGGMGWWAGRGAVRQEVQAIIGTR